MQLTSFKNKKKLPWTNSFTPGTKYGEQHTWMGREEENWLEDRFLSSIVECRKKRRVSQNERIPLEFVWDSIFNVKFYNVTIGLGWLYCMANKKIKSWNQLGIMQVKAC